MAHLYDLTHLVERISIDEAFLDVTSLRESGEALARRLQVTIWDEHSLPCSLGVATNKLVAKIANDVGKRSVQTGGPPMAIQVVPPGQEAAFLAPLPVVALWGVGPRTGERLQALGINTIGDIAQWPEDDLVHRFGKHGRSLARRARGIDYRPIATSHEAKSISRETTFAQDISDKATLSRRLRKLSESVGRRLRRANLCGSTVKIKLRLGDFTTFTRQATLDTPTDLDIEIFEAAEELFSRLWREGQPVRLIGVGVSRLQEPARQLSLWETRSEKTQRLQQALDSLRERFGHDTVRRATDLLDEDG
jgi:DNA polymerase-4